MNMESVMRSIIENGETITIIYEGGSKPGAKRNILPISIKDEKVKARCLSSNSIKHFMLNRIVIANSDENDVPFWEEVTEQEEEAYESLRDVYEKYSNKLVDLGWYIFLENNSLSLHRKQKRADKPLKEPSISLDYNEYTSDFVMGLDGEIREENIRKRARPYSLRAGSKDTITYGHLSSAFSQFIEWANELAPINQK